MLWATGLKIAFQSFGKYDAALGETLLRYQVFAQRMFYESDLLTRLFVGLLYSI